MSNLLTVVVACSEATPQLPLAKCEEDFRRMHTAMGPDGIGGLTEIKRQPERRALRKVFRQHVVMPTLRAMAPTVYGSALKPVAKGSRWGCAAVLGVNAARAMTWAIFEIDGERVALITVHYPPGAYNPGSAIQRLRRRTSLKRWAAYEAHRLALIGDLRQRFGVTRVITVGDTNRSNYALPGDHRLSRQTGKGNHVVYIGVRGQLSGHGRYVSNLLPPPCGRGGRVRTVNLHRITKVVKL